MAKKHLSGGSKKKSTAKEANTASKKSPSAGHSTSSSGKKRITARSQTGRGKAVLVTGALGFIGSHLCEKLAGSGPVIGLDRIDAAAVDESHPMHGRVSSLRKMGVELLAVDLKDEHLYGLSESILEKCDAVIHAAAPVKEKGPLEDFRAVNVRATVALARKAARNGVRRWVQLSSVMVYGFDYPENVTEAGPLRGHGNPYCITKIESEHALLGISGEAGMDVVVLRPGDVYGPGSVPWVVRPLQMMKKKQFLLLDSGRYTINHTHVSHIVQAVELALKTRGGQIFNITDGNSSSCREYFGALAALAGFPPPPSIPSSLASLGALFMEGGAAFLGREAQLNREALKFVMRPHPVSSSKAMEVLGYRPRVSLTQGLEEIRNWLRLERPDLQGPGFR